MAQVIADRRDVDFVLHEQFKVSELSKHEQFAEFKKKTVDLIVNEARNLAVKEILPTQKIGDQIGARFDKGKVTLPPEFHRAWELFTEGEWLAMPEDPEYGGQGMPRLLSMAANDYLVGANFSFMLYAGLTHGAGKVIQAFGNEEQKRLFLKNVFTGKWTGTMLLTEPEAGSDVGALNASAKKNPDGTYSITGTKIFISGGEHELTENIIHPVLARIEGAPPGTKGISLFLVPKYRVNPDGSLGEFNDVVCTGIEEKMGIHGNGTCSLTMGGKGNCIGTLLGEENKGMRAMFLAMNEARLHVGLEGFACASSAYLYALNYARERVQGKNLLQGKDPNAPSVPIIQHPDIRRILLTIKSYVEGMRSILYYVAYMEDCATVTDDPAAKAKHHGLIDILIPVAKGYVTDRSFEMCSLALQVYGGYGYISEYPMEQLLRDCRITMIYEGTNGIQAIDLFGRKLSMNNGQLVKDLFAEIDKTIAAAKAVEGLETCAARVENALTKLGEVVSYIGQASKSDQVLNAYASAHPFLDVFGDVMVAWMLLWRASIAAPLCGKSGKDAAFYKGQVKSAEFFTGAMLPVALGKMEAILSNNAAAAEIEEASFGG
ncbi:MAG: acyl-CoA dehydrogenase [Desulforhopalus sp.]|jgi:alkylation response protein AidB-like acyl-CoA dehydrogenase|nr:acyl-CoA dehydrogenase [Desulforhopalus sp.]